MASTVKDSSCEEQPPPTNLAGSRIEAAADGGRPAGTVDRPDIDEDEILEQRMRDMLERAEQFRLGNDGQALENMIEEARELGSELSRARAGKLVRSLIELYLALDTPTGREVAVCEATIEWARSENRIYLRRGLEVRLVTLLNTLNHHHDSLRVGANIHKELKKDDDKELLMEVYFMEAKSYFALSNLEKARSALFAARSLANSIYVPPGVQANLDLFSGILYAAETRDFSTAFSYFSEALQQHDHVEDTEAARQALKYMLLAKIMVNKPEDCAQLMTTKLVLEYQMDRDLEAMMAISRSLMNRSLSQFQGVVEEFSQEIQGDPVIREHLGSLYNSLVESNICRLVEPYSRVQVEHIASKLNMDRMEVEKRMSQMILEEKLVGTLDQELAAIILHPPRIPHHLCRLSLQVLEEIGTVVERMYKTATTLN